MKTYYTEEAWHLAAKEDPRNPSFTIVEISLCSTDDTLVITESEYANIEHYFDNLVCDDDEVLFDGDEYYGNIKDILDCVTIYKTVD